MKILDYLDLKPAHYAKIDYQRMPRMYEKYKEHFPLKPIIHVIGTNGKGSTGRWLALMIKQAGFLVGHYTSPHVLQYNERFWLNGQNVSYKKLDTLHGQMVEIFEKDDFDSLSYFEYSTFLAALAFKECDFVIFEAGLGGEYDATNVFEKRLSLITTIGYDHGDFLGFTLKSIATTKINSITTDSIISTQNSSEVIKIAQKIAEKKSLHVQRPKFTSNLKYIKKYIKKYDYPDFYTSNLKVAYFGAKYLQISPKMDTLPPLDLRGRCEKIAKNITIDVGHNPLSASVLAKNFKRKSVILVYNSFEDKDIKAILTTLRSVIKHVQILRLKSNKRELGEQKIKEVLRELGILWSYFDYNLKDDEHYLVFGSFYVVEEFLREFDAK